MSARAITVANRPIDATVSVPGSKSETIRSLACAALAAGRSHVYGPLYSDDTTAMASVLESFGVSIEKGEEPWAVDGMGGRLHADDVRLDAGESGLTARIAMAMAGSAEGRSTVVGSGRLPERPFAGLISALSDLGVEIDGESLPLVIIGRGPLWGGSVRVDCSETSQFASALMLVGPTMTEDLDLEIDGLSGSRGYIEMTARTMRQYGAVVERTVTGYRVPAIGYEARDVMVEPDASSATYPLVAAAITGGSVTIHGLASSLQPDRKVADVLAEMGCRLSAEGGTLTLTSPRNGLLPVDVDMADAPDGALALAVACSHAGGSSTLTGLHSLRHKESDRLSALESELAKLGVEVTAGDDFLRIGPGHLRGAEIDPHGDHRIAMALALVGLTTEGVSVSDPDVVNKTWPGFWQHLDDLSG